MALALLTLLAPAAQAIVSGPHQPFHGPSRSPLPPARGAAGEAGWPVGRICGEIETAAERHDLPAHFLARLIWKESRFDVGAISPVGAQGIAQFMPGTARLEGLSDPFDPAQAIPASAKHLADLRREFGNLGLAAAAYNSGRNRVSAWLAGRGALPGETLDYVHSITFRPADWFRRTGREVEPRPLQEGLAFGDACAQLPVLRTRAVFGGATARTEPWGVQVAGGIDRNAASRAFRQFARRHPTVMGGTAPQIVKNRRNRRIRYSAQVGRGSRAAAVVFCSRLRRAGGACTVVRN